MSCSICCADIGSLVFIMVGTAVGTVDGSTDGMAVGTTVGAAAGRMDGTAVGMVVGTAVGAVVGCCCNGDGSDVDDVKGFRCHGPCGIGVGTLLGSSSSSSSISTGSGFAISVKRLLMLGEGTFTVERFFFIALKCPFTVASALGGYFRS